MRALEMERKPRTSVRRPPSLVIGQNRKSQHCLAPHELCGTDQSADGEKSQI